MKFVERLLFGQDGIKGVMIELPNTFFQEATMKYPKKELKKKQDDPTTAHKYTDSSASFFAFWPLLLIFHIVFCFNCL